MSRDLIRKWLPGAVWEGLRSLRTWARDLFRRLRHAGRRRYCPVCRASVSQFVATRGRPDAVCPVCGSLERHRAVWMFLNDEAELAKRKRRLLHVAPEACYRRILERWSHLDYVTMDLTAPDVMLRADLTNLELDDAQFDLVLCNHVLEHIPDDRSAMSEVHRILRPGGAALFTVPRFGPARPEQTEEGGPYLDAEGRLERFGHPGHVRQYGRDLEQRLRDAGFDVEHRIHAAELPPAERTRLGIRNGYPILFCRK